MSSSNYRIKIIRAGEELEIEGDKKFVIEMLKRYDSEKPLYSKDSKPEPAGKSLSKATLSLSSKGKPISVGEFIRQIGLKKQTDIVLAFGYYLETYSGYKEFAPADINTCYYDSKLEPSNTSQMIIQNIKRGFIMQSKKAGKGDSRYLLTQSGVDFIRGKLNK